MRPAGPGLTRILHLSVDLRETRQTERMARQQLELQSRDYRAVRQKMELGRIYLASITHRSISSKGNSSGN